jgi:hypothetical protein
VGCAAKYFSGLQKPEKDQFRPQYVGEICSGGIKSRFLEGSAAKCRYFAADPGMSPLSTD